VRHGIRLRVSMEGAEEGAEQDEACSEEGYSFQGCSVTVILVRLCYVRHG
jgi:hypothetical protein